MRNPFRDFNSSHEIIRLTVIMYIRYPLSLCQFEDLLFERGTVFSEWLNIEVRQAWAYRDAMPVIPVLGAGLSPVLQWIIVPLAGFWWALPRVDGTDRNRETKFTVGAARDPAQDTANDRSRPG